jgi:hypothetical protein
MGGDNKLCDQIGKFLAPGPTRLKHGLGQRGMHEYRSVAYWHYNQAVIPTPRRNQEITENELAMHRIIE